MAKKTVAELKAFFETGDKPTGSQFADVMDSFINLLTESELEATILVNIPVLGTGAGGKVLKKGNALIQMGEYSDDDISLTTDNGGFASGGAIYLGSTSLAFYLGTIIALNATNAATILKYHNDNRIILSEAAGKQRITLDVLDEMILGKATAKIGFFAKTPTHSKQIITGSKDGNAALDNLLLALVNLGLITDNTT